MQKIPTLFVRDPDNMKRVMNAVTPGCEWVLAGEGRATVKWDGTACLWKDGRLWKRYELRPGKAAPCAFVPEGEPGPTGKQPGWVPVGDGPEDQWHREAAQCLEATEGWTIAQTYELIGPKVQGNPHGLPSHQLLRHGATPFVGPFVLDFDGIATGLEESPDSEGIVWHHPDGRMAKVKRKDFGLQWPPTAKSAESDMNRRTSITRACASPAGANASTGMRT